MKELESLGPLKVGSYPSTLSFLEQRVEIQDRKIKDLTEELDALQNDFKTRARAMARIAKQDGLYENADKQLLETIKRLEKENRSLAVMWTDLNERMELLKSDFRTRAREMAKAAIEEGVKV